ncbi:MAG: right-handed parallel beta-helix repeat-containing protein [Candidatus Pacebacteria bacterium]|nr:right-handed parallel beta-helix repeat-containing protein [Candidatus Paceibacterota bacterium]
MKPEIRAVRRTSQQHAVFRSLSIAAVFSWIAIFSFAAEDPQTSENRNADAPGDLMHLVEPADPSWNIPIPVPTIPDRPTGVGLLDASILREAEPMRFKNVAEIKAATEKPDALVEGSGTVDDPFVFRNLAFRGIRDQAAIDIQLPFSQSKNTRILIENVLVEGDPPTADTPARAYAFRLVDTQGTIVRHCRMSRCTGLYTGGSASRGLLVENCHLYSTVKGIFTILGQGHNVARGNYVHDSVEYGVFLYGSSDNIIEDNYISWCGKEGIGTNGKAPRQVYRRNVILGTGWTAINVEGACDDSLVEDNLVVNSHYGIILMGERTRCQNNKVFYSTQVGLYIHTGPKDKPRPGIAIRDNLVVGSGDNGVWAREGNTDVSIVGNRVIQANIGVRVNSANTLVAENEVSRTFRGLQTDGVTGCVIQNNDFFHARYAVTVSGSAGGQTAVRGNRLHHSIGGIQVGGSKGVLIEDNTISAVGMGIRCGGSEALEIRKNRIRLAGYSGIRIGGSKDCVLEDNRLSNCRMRGIWLNDASGHQVRRNAVVDNASMMGNAGLVLEKAQANVFEANEWRRCNLAILFKDEQCKENVFKNSVLEENGRNIAVLKGVDPSVVNENNTLEEAVQERK